MRNFSENRLILTAAGLMLLSSVASGCAAPGTLRDVTARSAVRVTEAAAAKPRNPAADPASDPIDAVPQPAAAPDSIPVSAWPETAITSDRPDPLAAPTPFRWIPEATSAGGRPIELVSVGNDGFRTLVVGSLIGDDPVGLWFTDLTARYLHENGMILGNINVRMIRTLNPDGEALRTKENSDGVYLNRSFGIAVAARESAAGDAAVRTSPPEVEFLKALISEYQPQRVIHLRSWDNSEPLVAASSGAMEAAKEAASWLGTEVRNLPAEIAPDTMEAWLALTEQCQVITFAVPAKAARSEIRDRYRDVVVNLLMKDSYLDRSLVRNKEARAFADRRTDGQSPTPDSPPVNRSLRRGIGVENVPPVPRRP